MGSFAAVVRDRPGRGLAVLRAVVVLALAAGGCLGAAVVRCQDGVALGFVGLVLGGGTILVPGRRRGGPQRLVPADASPRPRRR